MRPLVLLLVICLVLGLALDAFGKVKKVKADKKASKKEKKVKPVPVEQPKAVHEKQQPRLQKLKETLAAPAIIVTSQEPAQKPEQQVDEAPVAQPAADDGPVQTEEPVVAEAPFIPDLAKIKFVKQKKPKEDKPGCLQQRAACPCVQEATEAQVKGQDPRVAEALNDPDYLYMKLVPVEELPLDGSPEAACPLFVIPRKQEHLARTCLKVLKEQAEEAQKGDVSQEGQPRGTGSLLGDVTKAVRDAADRQEEKVKGQDSEGGDAKPVLQANKDLINEDLNGGYEGFGAI